MLSRKPFKKKFQIQKKNFQLCRKLIDFYAFRLFNQSFEQFDNSYKDI